MHVSTGALLPVKEEDKLCDQSEGWGLVHMCGGFYRVLHRKRHGVGSTSIIMTVSCVFMWLLYLIKNDFGGFGVEIIT